jgi:hypothetical protein
VSLSESYRAFGVEVASRLVQYGIETKIDRELPGVHARRGVDLPLRVGRALRAGGPAGGDAAEPPLPGAHGTIGPLPPPIDPGAFVDVKVCAVDETWSGLKLVIRRENRG